MFTAVPYSDELGREYTNEEARFWREAQHAAQGPGGQVRLVPIARSFSYTEQQVGQIGRTWENDGLVATSQAGRVILTLTPFGRNFRFEESYGDIE